MACGRDLVQLSFIGLMGMWDPPREGVECSVGHLRGSGVSVKMITGDARETGEAIAQHLRLWSPGSISLSGEQLENLPQQDLADTVVQVCLSVCLGVGSGKQYKYALCVATVTEPVFTHLWSLPIQTALFYRVTPKHKVIIVKVAIASEYKATTSWYSPLTLLPGIGPSAAGQSSGHDWGWYK